MERKIKTYSSIGKFFDDLTRLEPGGETIFKGNFLLWQGPRQDINNPEPSFNFSYLPDSRIEVILSRDEFSNHLLKQYWIRAQDTESKEWIAFHVPIETMSWEAHYKYNGGDSRVRGVVGYSSLVLDLEPNLKRRRKNK